MDPDMVRQQDEEELASRLGGRVKVKMPPARPEAARNEPAVLRAEPRKPETRGEPETRLVGVARAAQSSGITPWTAIQTAFACSVMTGLGLLGGIMLGVKLGLIPEQRLAIGAGAGLLLGWQASMLSLRRRGNLKLGRAITLPLFPTAIILGASIAGMAAAAHFTGIAQMTVGSEVPLHYWLIAGAGALAGTVIAARRLYKSAQS